MTTEEQRHKQHQLVGPDSDGDDGWMWAMHMEKIKLVEEAKLKGGSTEAKLREKLGPQCFTDVPQLHETYQLNYGWPDGISPDKARSLVFKGYLLARTLPWVQLSAVKVMGTTLTMPRWLPVELEELTRRKDEGNLQVGDVIDVLSDLALAGCDLEMGYSEYVRSNFANAANVPEVLYAGTTHVALGFNDLGFLLSAKLVDSSGLQEQQLPLHFVGYDRCPFAVAKFKVVAEMLKDEHVPLEHVLQVWFSSTWTTGCVASFKSKVRTILATVVEEGDNQAEGIDKDDLNRDLAKVKTYLSYWARVDPVSQAEARQQHYDLLSPERVCGVFSFLRENDRMALMHYVLTGEIGLQSELGCETPADALVGSMTMWSVPDTAPPMMHENAFSATAIGLLVKSRQGYDNIVNVFEQQQLKALARLRRLLMENRVVIKLYNKTLVNLPPPDKMLESPARVKQWTSLVHEIAALEPRTMSWSNLMDYFPLTSFHDVCRACSVTVPEKTTIHYGYTMNWSHKMYGMRLEDLEDPAEIGDKTCCTFSPLDKNYTQADQVKGTCVTPGFLQANTVYGECAAAALVPHFMAHFEEKARQSAEHWPEYKHGLVALDAGGIASLDASVVGDFMMRPTPKFLCPNPLDHGFAVSHLAWAYAPKACVPDEVWAVSKQYKRQRLQIPGARQLPHVGGHQRP